MATEMSLKLLVDKNRNKVLFAESGKDFVDFLFSLMKFPVGAIVRLLTPTQTTTGCIGNLYSSVNNLDNLYMQPKVDKSELLQPKIAFSGNEMQMLLMQDCQGNGKSSSNEPMKVKYYGCIKSPNCSYSRSCYKSVTTVMGAPCGSCGVGMTLELNFVDGERSTVVNGGGSAVGYVKEVVTYLITDDLVVKPMSTISSITLLNRCRVKDIETLEDRVVHLGTKEGLDLLRASLQSKSVLTDVFLKKGIKLEPCSSPKTCPTTYRRRFCSSSKISISLKSGIVGLPNVGKSSLFNSVWESPSLISRRTSRVRSMRVKQLLMLGLPKNRRPLGMYPRTRVLPLVLPFDLPPLHLKDFSLRNRFQKANRVKILAVERLDAFQSARPWLKT
ncbi:hypothetical protein NE237_010985 [Protea cynaroides]|uniref:G domain-containing protein n=1 Tax=Protea cynaroides TaxID=273540 RepID=A0A9Q0R278_9MAGN|nr:hypothetical protein NE237_010985 [Protea cynaroides]